MQGQGQGFSVTISAFDQFTATINNFNKAIRQTSQQIQQFQTGQAQQAGRRDSFFDRVSTFTTRGARELSRGFREVGTVAVDMGRKIATAFEPLAILGGVGAGAAGVLGIAGIAASINNLAKAGADLGRTSARIGVGTTEIQKLDAAAQLAGVSTGVMSDALETLGQKLTGAALGQDPQAMAFFKQFNIAVRNTDGTIRSSVGVMDELADAFAQIKNPQVQADFATKAFAGSAAQLLPFLRQGRAGLQEYRREAERYGSFLSEQGVEATHEFERAQARLSLALTGVGNSITEKVLPVLSPMITGMADWIAQNRQWIAQNLADATTAFGKALQAVDWKSIGQLVSDLGKAFSDVGNALKLINDYTNIFSDLLKWQGLGGVFGLGRGGLVQPGPGSPRIEPFTPEPGIGGWIRRNFNFGNIFGQGAGYQPGRQGALIAPYEAISRAEGTFGRAGINYNMMQGGQPMPGLTNMTIGDVMQMQGGPGRAAGAFQIEQATLGDAARALGFGETTRFTPNVQRQMADWIYQKQGIQAWRGFLAHPELLPGSNTGYGGIPTLGASAMFPALPAPNQYNVGNKPFGQSPSDYGPGSPLGRIPPAGLGGADSPTLIPGGALDSKHSVEININGAPQGTRAAITSAEGPAQATLRTHFAFSGI